MVAKPRIFTTSFASVYPLYVQKAGKKGRTQDEVDQVIAWLTGYRGAALQRKRQTRLLTKSLRAVDPA